MISRIKIKYTRIHSHEKCGFNGLVICPLVFIWFVLAYHESRRVYLGKLIVVIRNEFSTNFSIPTGFFPLPPYKVGGATPVPFHSQVRIVIIYSAKTITVCHIHTFLQYTYIHTFFLISWTFNDEL